MKSGVGYKVFHGSTLVTAKAVTHWRCNGRSHPGISSRRLGSGIALAVSRSLLTNWLLSEGLLAARVFVTAFLEKMYHT